MKRGLSRGHAMAGLGRRAAKEKVQAPLEPAARVTLSKRDFLAFNAAVSGNVAPNPALQAAHKAAAKVKRA